MTFSPSSLLRALAFGAPVGIVRAARGLARMAPERPTFVCSKARLVVLHRIAAAGNEGSCRPWISKFRGAASRYFRCGWNQGVGWRLGRVRRGGRQRFVASLPISIVL